MELQSLGYIGIRARDVDDWADFGAKFLGMQLVDRSRSTLTFRMDDRRQRVVVHADGGEGAAFLGWEVADGAGARCARRPVSKRPRVGVQRHGRRRVADERRVKEIIRFEDPAGNVLEAFHGAEVALGSVPPRPRHLRLSHRSARHGSRRDERRARSIACCRSIGTCSASG